MPDIDGIEVRRPTRSLIKLPAGSAPFVPGWTISQMGIGLYAAGAPRVVTLVAFTPAVLAAVVLGVDEPGGRKPKH